MRKRILSLLLCLAVLLTMALPVHADELEETEVARTPDLVISDVKEFLLFAEDCRLDSYSVDLYVVLEADIDLAGRAFDGVPIFSGTFDGAGHTISGLELTADGSAKGLFRYLTDTALVQDLQVKGTVQPGGSHSKVGGIAGENRGSIRNCSFEGTVSGAEFIGGITGSNAVTGILENCRVSGEVYGEHFVGGIAGGNQGVIRECENRAEINSTPQQNTVNIADITLDTLTNSEAINTVTDIGGIAGNSTGVIRGCTNYAGVGYKHMGYNIGGIAGTQSGYITACENYGFVQGRKEVGGIVGQMEPASVVEYSEDTLQILQGQLNTMGGMVNRVSSNAQSNATGISGQLGKLQNQSESAKDAVESLIPDRNNPQLPDMDTLVAAQNTLNSSFNGMASSIRGLANSTQNMISSLSRDMQAMSNQISVMSNTINNGSENMGASITDVSDQDTPEDLSGKVDNSTNYADVLGEVNVGGIAGALAMENDADVWEDWELYGETSMNFSGEVRAVVLNCENLGVVNGQKQNVGGIAGWQSVGLVKGSTNTGKLAAENANYVGGITGMSTGFIRWCSVKSEIHGAAAVGGIAGGATIVSDSLSMVELLGVSEKAGAILGQIEQLETEEEKPIARNYYLQVGEDVGAIDGISYAGQAESLSQGQFLVRENLSAIFKDVSIRFVYEDGTVETLHVTPGGRLSESRIPEVPQKDGYSGQWDGLAEADLTEILFDMQIHAVYDTYRKTLESQQVNVNGHPLAFLEGSFTHEAVLTIEPCQEVPNLADGEVLLESWKIYASEPGHTARVWYGEEGDTVKVLVNGVETDSHMDGSYLVFAADGEEMVVHLVQPKPSIPWWILAAAGGAVALVLILVIVSVKKRKKTAVTVTE